MKIINKYENNDGSVEFNTLTNKGWIKIYNKEVALQYAKYVYNQIKDKDRDDVVKHINKNRFKRIKFTREELE